MVRYVTLFLGYVLRKAWVALSTITLFSTRFILVVKLVIYCGINIEYIYSVVEFVMVITVVTKVRSFHERLGIGGLFSFTIAVNDDGLSAHQLYLL